MKASEKRLSIKDVAEKAGVSTSLVSYVLNGKGKEHRVSEEMAEKVLQVAKELNYHPNMAARSLRTGKTKTLGLIVADISNPFFAKLARRIENIAWEKGYQVIFGSSDESKDKFEKLTSVFINKQVDGMIVVPTTGCEDSIMQLVNSHIPTVMLDRHIDNLPVSSVQIDNEAAGYALTSFLLKNGCRRIAFFAYNLKLSNIEGRYEGYRKALQDNGVSSAGEIVESVEFAGFEENVPVTLKKILASDVDAIVFANNQVATQSLQVLARMDKPPSRLVLASMDHPEFGLSNIPFHYIEQPLDEMGKKAIEILFKQIKEPKKQIVEQVILKVDWEQML